MNIYNDGNILQMKAIDLNDKKKKKPIDSQDRHSPVLEEIHL